MLAIYCLTSNINKLKNIHCNASINVGYFHRDIVEWNILKDDIYFCTLLLCVHQAPKQLKKKT